MVLVFAASPALVPLSGDQREDALRWIAEMRANSRGPYLQVAWVCADGMVFPPETYPCTDHGGGIQHALLGDRAQRLAAMGIHVGTIVATLSAEQLVASDAYRARAYIVERYLERALDGWTLAAAQTYRGFRQLEDEQAAAAAQLTSLAGDDAWFGPQRLLLRHLLRALPYTPTLEVVDAMRDLARELGDADPVGFGALRAKIHTMPEADDRLEVIRYSFGQPRELAEKALQLAAHVRAFFGAEGRRATLIALRDTQDDAQIRQRLDAFLATDAGDALGRIETGTALLEAADNAITAAAGGASNLRLFTIMEVVEQSWLAVAAHLLAQPLSRRQLLQLLDLLVRGARTLGWISPQEFGSAWQAQQGALSGNVAQYVDGFDRLSRLLDWARWTLLGTLGTALQRYQEVEPKAFGIIDEQLRASVMMPLSHLLDRMAQDVTRLRGGGHRLVGMAGLSTTALRGENSGIAVGPLRVVAPGESTSGVAPDAVVLLHHLPPELPPVAGIITVGSTASLSHVALLARNLGIPHATVDEAVAAALARFSGQDVVLGVSLGHHRVVLGPVAALDSSEAALLRRGAATPGVGRLRVAAPPVDLDERILSLADISERDKGVRVGAKAAELARLWRWFPGRVPNAVVIPFASFLHHVDRPAANGGPSPLAALRQSYREAREAPAEEEQAKTAAALAAFRESIVTTPFAAGFAAQVRAALGTLGPAGTFGVFVRSDTNVEDTEAFTGAGLNKTVPNRISDDAIFAAIAEVWASPFNVRAFGWRQRSLRHPLRVYPSVILHKTLAADISGVMVTADLENPETDGITISAGEGVAAVVEGGAPQTVVVTQQGTLRLLASCRATQRKIIPDLPQQGVVVVAPTRRDPLLREGDIDALAVLAREVRARMGGSPATPWDIEFGLRAGKAFLLQVRPLKTSQAARGHPLLRALDAHAAVLAPKTIDLAQEVP